MGTFHVFIRDLLDSGASITITCFCLRTAVWTNDHLALFPRTLRLWNATADYRCATCGRVGKVRQIDVHMQVCDTAKSEREYVRRPIPLKGRRQFGKRRPSAKVPEQG